MGNFWSKLFGSLAMGTPIVPTKLTDFIPTNSGGDATIPKNVMFLNKEPEWLGLTSISMQYWAYYYCSPLASVIDRLAEADINGEVEFLTDDKKEDYAGGYDVKRLQQLFRTPNPMQTWEEFRGQQVTYKKIFGYCPVFVITPAGMDRSFSRYMWNINPLFAQPIIKDYGSGNFSLYKDTPLIDYWEFNVAGQMMQLNSKDIIILKDGFVDRNYNQYGLPVSKICGLDYAISNIIAAMEADNVLLRKKGPLGFLSHEPRPDSVAGYVPLKEQEKIEIQQELEKYGLSWDKWQYAITKQGMRWNPMSYNIQELMTKETAREGIDTICDRFGYPAELMSGKNATYENRRSAEKFLYDTIVIPCNCRDMRQYSEFFGLTKVKIECDFDDMPILQEDIVKQGQGNNYESQSNLILFQNSVITLNEWRSRQGIDTVNGDDIYYQAYLEKYKPQPEPTTQQQKPGTLKAVV